MLPGLANKTTLFTVCDERWGGKYIMGPKLTCTLQPQSKILICIPVVKLALYFLLASVNTVLQKHENQVETQNNFTEELHIPLSFGNDYTHDYLIFRFFR